MILYYFYRFLFVASLAGTVIFAPQVSKASQLSALQGHEKEPQETITGHILSIDQASGIITVETETGIVNLEAAPEAFADWKAGDPVVVTIDATTPREHEEFAEGKTTPSQSSSAGQSEEVGSR